MARPPTAVEPRSDGVDLRIRLTPKASRDALGAIERLSDDSEVLVAHVRAAPSDGEANAALVRLVATSLGVARTRVAVVAGPTSRVKLLRVEGDPDTLVAAIAELSAGVANRDAKPGRRGR